MTDADITNKEELKKRLTPLQYHVTQEKGTERYLIRVLHQFKRGIKVMRFLSKRNFHDGPVKYHSVNNVKMM